MADATLSPHIVTDPHTLMSATQAIAARVLPQPGPYGSLAGLLVKQLRLVFIDTRQSLFVFGSPDPSVLAQANLYARRSLENALKDVFKEKVRLELVLFDGNRDALIALIARFTEAPPGAEPPPYLPPDPPGLEVEPDREEDPSPVEVRVGGPMGDPVGGPTEGRERGERTVQVKLIQDSLRSIFTSPKRVVVVPGYLLRWLPYIGPLRTSIVVACFQAFYLSRGSTAKANQTFEASGPFLAAVAGIAESSVWRHLDDPELGWFLKRVPYGPDENRWIRDERAGLVKKRPSRFSFRSTAPLTPGDAEALLAYLSDLDIRKDPVEVLTEIVRGQHRVEPRDVFPFPPAPPARGWQKLDPDRCLIHNVIFSAIGTSAHVAPKNLVALVDELAERLLPPTDQVHLSWYYLLHWLPLLGHGPGWATILLRDRCYYNRQTGELRDVVGLRSGYHELAEALGLQRPKTVREWFPAPHAQKEADKSADLSATSALEGISHSKRSFLRQYTAKFVEVTQAEADGRGQVSSFKARVSLFDPLTPAHQAIYNSLLPVVQACFSLTEEQRAAFLDAYEEIASLDMDSVEKIIGASLEAAGEIILKHENSSQPGAACPGETLSADNFLGAFERVSAANPGANGRFTSMDAGAFERIASLIPGAFGGHDHSHPGAFGGLGRVFWAQMRGLKYMVLNNHLDETLYEYLKSTNIENTAPTTTSTTAEASKGRDENGQVVGVEIIDYIENWDISKLLSNFNPQVRRELSEKNFSVEALVSCLLYIASSKGDNLGLGYVVDKLKWDPQDGQGGIYRRLAEEGRQEIVARLRHYMDYRSFQNRDWRVAMGTPSIDKILELMEHLGIDSSRFGSQEEWGL